MIEEHLLLESVKESAAKSKCFLINFDRFAVLLDIWTNEANFLEMKKNLLEIYYDVYQNVFDKNEKRNLAQVVALTIFSKINLVKLILYFVHPSMRPSIWNFI